MLGLKVSPVFPIQRPGSSCLSFLGLSGLPFCHQANFMSGSQGYGAARETSSCTEGEHWGNPPCPCPSGTCSAGEGGEARAKLKVRNIQRQRQPGDNQSRGSRQSKAKAASFLSEAPPTKCRDTMYLYSIFPPHCNFIFVTMYMSV